MLDTLTREMLEPIIGQKFLMTLPETEETMEIELVDVEELPTGRKRRNAPEPKRLPFSLFFVGERLLPQGTYPLQHEIFGGKAPGIFLVPMGAAKEGGYEYEAVFT